MEVRMAVRDEPLECVPCCDVTGECAGCETVDDMVA